MTHLLPIWRREKEQKEGFQQIAWTQGRMRAVSIVMVHLLLYDVSPQALPLERAQ